jgi:hypothetical protein
MTDDALKRYSTLALSLTSSSAFYPEKMEADYSTPNRTLGDQSISHNEADAWLSRSMSSSRRAEHSSRSDIFAKRG